MRPTDLGLTVVQLWPTAGREVVLSVKIKISISHERRYVDEKYVNFSFLHLFIIDRTASLVVISSAECLQHSIE